MSKWLGAVFRYRIYDPDGNELGEATYAMQIGPGETIHLEGGGRWRVVTLLEFDEADASPFVGALNVEPV